MTSGWQSTIRNIYFLTLVIFVLLQAGCASLPDISDRPKSYAISDSSETSLAKSVFQNEKQAGPGESGFLLLGEGLDAFVARAVLADRAERSIDAQYFILNDDVVGRTFLGLLIRAADRGVRIRLLLDDYWKDYSDFQLLVFDAHPNFEIRIINPFSRRIPRGLQLISRFGSVTRRMHNKSFIVDNQIAVTGGRNIADEYFDADPEINFGDIDVLSMGPVVQEVSNSFDQYWNSDLSYPISRLARHVPTSEEARAERNKVLGYMAENTDSEYAQALLNSNLANSLRNDSIELFQGKARVVADSPEKLSESRNRKDLHLSQDIQSILAKIENEVIIFTPYFIPGKIGVDGLSKLVAKGVRVRIMTNSSTSIDHGVVHSHYAKYRKALLERGIELHEVYDERTIENSDGDESTIKDAKANMLHGKTFVFDRQSVFIGSLNMDSRSWTENTEMGVVYESEELSRGIAEWFDNNVERVAYRVKLQPDEKGRNALIWEENKNGQHTQHTVEPGSTFWGRLKMKLLGLLPIESQL